VRVPFWPWSYRDQVLARLDDIDEKLELIMTSQQDIDSAVAGENAAIADLATQDAAIQAAQAALLAEIQALRGQGVNTAGLVAASASLATALGAADSAVAALTAAAAPPAGP
jgi:hypothetical protein